MTESNLLLSRQPIFSSKTTIAAYELRSNYDTNEDEAQAHDAERAIFSMFTDTVFDLVIGDYPGLITLTHRALTDGLWRTVPKTRAWFGYFQPFEPGDEAAKQLAIIAAQGYRLVIPSNASPSCLETFDSVKHIVKLDVTAYKPDKLEAHVAELRKYKTKILAERVDTHDDLEFCKSLKIDFCQGHFLSKPAAQVSGIPVNRISMIRLLSRLQDPQIPMVEAEKLVSQDIALSYKLLRYANSAAVALPRTVNSVGHAVRLVGMDSLRTWSSALLLSSVDNKPRELMNVALIRANMCELLGKTVPNAQKESYLSAGLLSVLDALLDSPMELALKQLPLSDEINEALISRSGPIGQALRCTIAYERADWDNVQFYGLAQSAIREKYMEAIAWSRKLNSGLLN